MATPEPPAAPLPPVDQGRLVSLDAYRGAIMLAMVSAGLGIPAVARSLREAGVESRLWDLLSYHTTHVAWTGCAFWDLIQPSFMFMVGVAMPFSFAKRRLRGQSDLRLWAHVITRAILLTLLGVFLSSNWSRSTNWTFVNVLSQIGLGYVFLYLFLGRGLRAQITAVVVVLTTYWLFFALWPLPGADHDAAAVGVGEGWQALEGFFAHWNKNANPAHYLDVWLLNEFPRESAFTHNGGGYQTLNFVPSIATMLFGLIAGELLRSDLAPAGKLRRLVLWGLGSVALGWLLGQAVCPIVKRIWTPSWAIYSTGWTLLILAGFYGLIDVRGWRGWAKPFVVVGMNSIAMYLMAQLIKGWVRKTLHTHLPEGTFGGTHGPLLESVVVLSVLWLITLWMYRRRIFLRL